MPLLVGMTEVSTQTPTPPPSDMVQPVGGAPTPAAVPPTADTATPNPNANQPAATLETPHGAGGGVDFEKMDTNAFERLLESLPDEGGEVETPELGNQTTGPAAAPANPPAAPAAAAPAPTAEVKPGAEATVDHEEGVLAPGKLPSRIKVPTDDPLSFHTARLFKEARQAGRQMTLGEAEVHAKQFLGLDAAPTDTLVDDTGAAAPAPTTTQPPPTGRVAHLTEQLEAATAAFEEAAEGFDAKQQAASLREINRLNREIAEATVHAQREEAAAVTQQAAEHEAFLQSWHAAEAKAHAMFAHADAANPASPLHQRAAAMQTEYRDSQDPAMQAIYNSPNSALFFFTQAAAELSIQPGLAPAGAAPVSPPSQVKSTPPPVTRQVPVGAALLATGTGGNPAAHQAPPVMLPRNLHEFEQLVEHLPG